MIRIEHSVGIIGIGNPDRGDDGIGLRVVADLAARLPQRCKVMACSGDVLSLVNEWRQWDAVVCVDAAEPDGRPGRIRRFDLAVTRLPVLRSSVSSHAVGLSEAIALAKALHCLPPRVIVYAVEGSQFGLGAGLSPKVERAIARVAARVDEDIRLLASGSSDHHGEFLHESLQR